MQENAQWRESCEFLRRVNHSETQTTLIAPMLRAFFISLAAICCIWAAMAQNAVAQDRYASIIVDADSLDVLHARQIDELRYPASLTKVMTLYLVFDEIQAGRLTLGSSIKVSANAARTPPVKMGLKAGQTISVHELVQAIAVKSYNDAAVTLAEHIGGTEEAFAVMMTQKARALGMRKTTFKNASGLPNVKQQTTARDMAKLGNSMMRYHSQYFHFFGQQYYRGKRNTNALLFTRDDVTGFKTGYTRASGYNLMVSAQRNGRQQIAIVLGGASSATRNRHMSDLIDRGFEIMGQQASPVRQVSRSSSLRQSRSQRTRSQRSKPKSETPVIIKLRGANSMPRNVQTAGTPINLPKGGDNWSVQIKGFESEAQARLAADTLKEAARAGRPDLRSGFVGGVPVYHARLTGLAAQAAQQICASDELRLALGSKRCLIISP